MRGAEPLVSQHRQGRVHGGYARQRAARAHRVQHFGFMVGLRPRWPAGSFYLQLRALVTRTRCVLQRGWPAQVVLHAGSVSRRYLLAVSQSRQRHLRGCDRDQRHFRQQLKIIGRGDDRLRPGRLARSAGGQRHAAEQTLPKSWQRKIQGCGGGRGIGVQRGR